MHGEASVDEGLPKTIVELFRYFGFSPAILAGADSRRKEVKWEERGMLSGGASQISDGQTRPIHFAQGTT